MSTATTSTVAVRLNLATITQYLSAQSSLADTLAGRDPRRAVLLRSSPRWDGPAEHTWGDGLSARIAAAPSPLAVHELLLGHLSGTATGPALLVVLTDREQNELDPAILARAHKKRIDTVDSWDVVRDAFGAHQVDQRLRDDKWAAEALLDAAPPRGGWPRLGGGILSRGTALSALALRRLRLGSYEDEAARQDHTTSADRLDTHALLGWSLLPGRPERFLALRGPERGGLAEFLGEDDRAGLAGRALLALVEAEQGPDAVAFGLVCAALWCHAEPDATVYTARGRAERWFGERPRHGASNSTPWLPLSAAPRRTTSARSSPQPPGTVPQARKQPARPAGPATRCWSVPRHWSASSARRPPRGTVPSCPPALTPGSPPSGSPWQPVRRDHSTPPCVP